MDFLLAHMFYADRFQTSLYGKNVTSIPWILEENIGDISRTVTAMRLAINNYLTRYYDSANVDVSSEDADPDNSTSKVLIKLAITVIDDGVEYQANRLVSIVDGRFKEFVNLNNTSAPEH
jgi:hypothetical protein